MRRCGISSESRIEICDAIIVLSWYYFSMIWLAREFGSISIKTNSRIRIIVIAKMKEEWRRSLKVWVIFFFVSTALLLGCYNFVGSIQSIFWIPIKHMISFIFIVHLILKFCECVPFMNSYHSSKMRYIYKNCLLRKNLSRLEGKTSQQINQRYTRTFFENRNTQEQKIVLWNVNMSHSYLNP